MHFFNYSFFVTLLLVLPLVSSCKNTETTLDSSCSYFSNDEQLISSSFEKLKEYVTTKDTFYLYFYSDTCSRCKVINPFIKEYFSLNKDNLFYFEISDLNLITDYDVINYIKESYTSLSSYNHFQSYYVPEISYFNEEFLNLNIGLSETKETTFSIISSLK